VAAPALGYWPRVAYPQSFNEKIIHRKLYTQEPVYAQVADKWAVRAYVEEKVGDHVLNEVYHVTDDPSTIPFDSLPDKFVIKGTHGSGYVIVVEERIELGMATTAAESGLESLEDIEVVDYAHHPLVETTERLQ